MDIKYLRCDPFPLEGEFKMSKELSKLSPKFMMIDISRTMRNTIRITVIILVGLLLAGNAFCGDSAEIIAFNAPLSLLQRGQQTQVTVTVENTGTTPKNFWIGLSFAHETATGDSWPVGWYDIKPLQSKILSASGGKETLTFNFQIPVALRGGQYYALAKVWEDFDDTYYRMERPLYYSTLERNDWADNPNLGKESFSLPPIVFSEDINGLLSQFSKIAMAAKGDDISSLYANNTKPLLYLNSSVLVTIHPGVSVDVGGAILIDMADLSEATPEGQNEGWVTVWVVNNIGASAFSHSFTGDTIPAGVAQASVGTGMTFFDFDYRGSADFREDVIEYGKVSLPFFSFSLIEYSRSGDLNFFNVGSHGNNEIGLSYVNGKTVIDTYEIRRDLLLNALKLTNRPEDIYSSIEYADNVLKLLKDLVSHDNHIRAYTLDDGYREIYSGDPQHPLSLCKVGNYFPIETFKINVPEHVESLTLKTTGGSGDLKLIALPPGEGNSISSYTHGTTSEIIHIDPVSSGTCYIRIQPEGSDCFQNVTFIAEIISDNYTITASSGPNGSINPEDVVYVEKGSSKTFNATPNTGYEVDRWEKNGVNGLEVQNGGSSFTVTNVQSPTTVSVTFKSETGFLTHNGPWTANSGDFFPINGYVFDALGYGINDVTVYAKINGSIIGQGVTNVLGYYSIPNTLASSTSGQFTLNIEAAWEGQIISASDILTVSSDSSTYTISTATEFVTYMSNAANMNNKFKLTADINLDDLNNGAGRVFTTAIIAPDTNSSEGYQGTPFTGKFDGQGFRIRHIEIDATGTGNDYLGLFGKIGVGGRVLNLKLTSGFDIEAGDNSEYIGGITGYSDDGYIINCDIYGNQISVDNNCSYLGRLVGYDNRGLIMNCHVDGSVLSDVSTLCAGGLIGEAWGSDIDNCSATGNIRGHENSQCLGGLIGKATECQISNSFATGWLEGREDCLYLGGLIGYAYDDCIINRCYATGEVRSDEPDYNMTYVGGLVGWLEDSDIIESYSTSTINALDTRYVGGLTGYNRDGATINRSYYQGSIYGDDYIGGVTGRNFIDCSITDSYAEGTINGTNTVGGIVGQNQSGCNIANCYSVAVVNASSWTGGIIGDDYQSTVADCYFLDTSALDNGYGLPLTDSQMRQQASFTGWDFNNIWHAPANAYLLLSWQVEWITVPDVVGLSQASAESAITSVGLVVGAITNAYNNTVLAGNVISQNPVSGSSVVTGSTVDIIISLGAYINDADNDGLSDEWENQIVEADLYDDIILIEDVNPKDDFDTDGYCNLREWLSQTSPTDVSDIPPCFADFDNDADIDGLDLNILAEEFGRDDCLTGAPACEADLDGDGDVDETDLFLFSEDYGRLCGDESTEGWNYIHGDLAGTNYYPYGSRITTNTTFQEDFNIAGANYVLTGDVDGDGLLEIVFTSGSSLTILDENYSQQVMVTMPSDGFLTMIDDVDGDDIKDVGIGTSGGIGKIYFYNGQGELIKTISRSIGDDGSIHPMALTESGNMLLRGNSGYSKDPRGIYLYNYTTGQQIWGYDVGPAAWPGITSIADIDNDGKMEYVLDSGTPHNGASANGTTDGDTYLVVVDDDGSNLVTQIYPSPSNGSVGHIFTDLNRDGTKEVVAIERHDPTYYRGACQVHLYDLSGTTLYSYDGPSDEDWMWSIADIDNDGYDNVIVGGHTVLTILNENLQEVRSIQEDGFVYLTCDLTGDGSTDIVTVNNSNLLRVYDYQLNLISSFQLNGAVSMWRGIAASDCDNDEILELIVPTGTGLQVLSFLNL